MWMFFQAALREANKSNYRVPMGAVLVYRNKIVGRGCNIVFSNGRKNLDSIHAERSALRNSPKDTHRGGIIVVGRKDKMGQLALAKPCSHCKRYMKKAGIKRVWYSSADGWVKMDI